MIFLEQSRHCRPLPHSCSHCPCRGPVSHSPCFLRPLFQYRAAASHELGKGRRQRRGRGGKKLMPNGTCRRERKGPTVHRLREDQLQVFFGPVFRVLHQPVDAVSPVQARLAALPGQRHLPPALHDDGALGAGARASASPPAADRPGEPATPGPPRPHAPPDSGAGVNGAPESHPAVREAEVAARAGGAPFESRPEQGPDAPGQQPLSARPQQSPARGRDGGRHVPARGGAWRGRGRRMRSKGPRRLPAARPRRRLRPGPARGRRGADRHAQGALSLSASLCLEHGVGVTPAADGLWWLVEGRGRCCHPGPRAGQGRDPLENRRPGVVQPVIFTTAVPELTLKDVSEVAREISRRERKPQDPRRSLPRAWAHGLCVAEITERCSARVIHPPRSLRPADPPPNYTFFTRPPGHQFPSVSFAVHRPTPVPHAHFLACSQVAVFGSSHSAHS